MPINTPINLKVVKSVAEALEELKNEVLFVGGSVVSLYATDPAASEPRPTKDIDVSVQIASYAEMNKLSDVLASKGFLPAPESSILYRHKFNEVLIDFIPFAPTPLGPTNSWLKPGFKVSENFNLDGVRIRILPVTYFLASKWEAFQSRGAEDPISSHDLEDFIYIIDYHTEIVQSVKNAESTVKEYLKATCKQLLSRPDRDEFIEAQLIPSIAANRRSMIIEKLQMITE